jgi:membrane protein YdbS with pleckstrin-like domain
MTQAARQFWLVIAPLLVGLSAVGLLAMAFFFPGDLYAVDSTGSLLTAVVAVAALGVLIWQTVASEQRFVGGLDPLAGRDR